MPYLNKGGRSPGRYCRDLCIRRASLKRFATVLLLLCLSPAAVAADSPTKTLRQSIRPIVAVRFTPGGGVISVSKDGRLTMWSNDSDRPLWSISFERPPQKNDYTRIQITAMDISLDGRMAAVAYLRFGVDRNLVDEKAGDSMKQKDGVWEPHLILIDTADGAIKRDILESRETTIWDVIFSATGKSIFSTRVIPLPWAPKNHQSPISTVRVLSVETGNEVRSFKSEDWMGRAALSPDGKIFAVTTFRYTESLYKLQVYDAETGRLRRGSQLQTSDTSALAFSPDGRLLAVSRSQKDGIRIDLVPTDGVEKPPRTIAIGESAEVRALAFIPNQHQIAIAGGRLPLANFGDVGDPIYKDEGGAVIVIDEGTGKKLKTHKFKSFVTSLAISPDGSIMAVGMYNGQIAIFTPQ